MVKLRSHTNVKMRSPVKVASEKREESTCRLAFLHESRLVTKRKEGLGWDVKLVELISMQHNMRVEGGWLHIICSSINRVTVIHGLVMNMIVS